MDAFQLKALASSGDSMTLWLQDSSCDAPGVSITPRTEGDAHCQEQRSERCPLAPTNTAPNPAQKQFKEDQRDLDRETKSSPCSAELKPRQECLHALQTKEKHMEEKVLPPGTPMLLLPTPWTPCLECWTLHCHSRTQRGDPQLGTMMVYSADHKPNPLWFLIGIWAKLI